MSQSRNKTTLQSGKPISGEAMQTSINTRSTPSIELSPRQLALDVLQQNLPNQTDRPANDAMVDPQAFYVEFAKTEEDVRAAQQLRYQIFAEEMGAELKTSEPGIDIDIYDPYCEHLLVRHRETHQVVGTYRILTPTQAQKVGGYYSENEFFMNRLHRLAPTMIEVGRSCVHVNYRTGAVIMLLWTALAQYARQHGYEYLVGCASVSMRDGGHQAASLYRQLQKYLAPVENHVFPKHPLPLGELHDTLEVEAPPLVKGYLRLGGKICGDPAWDADFNTADFLVLVELSKISPRYARHFGLI